MSIIKSIKGFFGQTIHYKDGIRVGETWDGLLPGIKKHYNAEGEYVGSSASGFFADKVHYNQYGSRIGESWTDEFGTTRHYGNNGQVGTSYDGLFGTTTQIFDRPKDVLFESTKSVFDEPEIDFDKFGNFDKFDDFNKFDDFDNMDTMFDDSDW